MVWEKGAIMITKILNALLFVVAVFASGCNSDSQSHSPKVHHISISEMKFQPAEITLMKGDTVEWVNNDIVAHNVRELKNDSWASPTLASGESWKMVVTQSADYYCSIHVVMKGKLILK
jgi:plastocyanin